MQPSYLTWQWYVLVGFGVVVFAVAAILYHVKMEAHKNWLRSLGIEPVSPWSDVEDEFDYHKRIGEEERRKQREAEESRKNDEQHRIISGDAPSARNDIPKQDRSVRPGKGKGKTKKC